MTILDVRHRPERTRTLASVPRTRTVPPVLRDHACLIVWSVLFIALLIAWLV